MWGYRRGNRPCPTNGFTASERIAEFGVDQRRCGRYHRVLLYPRRKLGKNENQVPKLPGPGHFPWQRMLLVFFWIY